MNMDYKEPRNGDFASYVEELSRHFDMKEQAVNPDFSSGFPSQVATAAARSNSKTVQAAAQRSTARAAATVASSQAQARPQGATAGKPQTGFETSPAAPAKRQGKSFPSFGVIGLIIMAMFIVARSVNPNAEGVGGPLIFILVILFIIFRRIRNAAKRFPTSVKTKKQT